MRHFDFVVLGGGSAGFNAARVAADLGLSVALIDGAKELGGLCILRGCMPSKTLLHVAELAHHAREAGEFGLRIPEVGVDMAAVQAWKRRVIAEFAGYRERAMMRSDRYTLMREQARFVDSQTVELSGGERVRGRFFLIATGSRIAVPGAVPGLAETPQWTSDEVLDLAELPTSVIVLGGGIVACELAQFLLRMGVRVILIQRSAQILRDHSEAAARVVQEAFRAEGMELHTRTRVLAVRATGAGGEEAVEVEFFSDGERVVRRAARLFNALGREPNTAGLGLELAGVEVTEAGRVRVNEVQQTSVPHIYAGGDVCGPHDVVHLAVAQGELAARHAAGVAREKLRPVAEIPLVNVVFTDPPIATIGETEEMLREAGREFLVASYPFDDHGKSILMRQTRGFVKVVAEPKTGRILGAEIVGPQAGELIHVFSPVLELGGTVQAMLRAPWYHPTLVEIVTYPLEEIAEKMAVDAG